jgi:hypothetical protein
MGVLETTSRRDTAAGHVFYHIVPRFSLLAYVRTSPDFPAFPQLLLQKYLALSWAIVVLSGYLIMGLYEVNVCVVIWKVQH